MPKLTLVATSLDDQALSQPIVALFDHRGGTIGRADHNTMALPDPQRHISRLQAEVLAQGAGFVLRNVGAANPIQLGARSLAQGETAALQPGQELRIGGYRLQVQADEGEDARSGPARLPTPVPATLSGPHARRHGLPSTPGPFDDLLSTPAAAAGSRAVATARTGPDSSADPFADLLSGAQRAEPARRGPDTAPAAPARPVATPAAGPGSPAASPTTTSDPFADLLGPGAGTGDPWAGTADAAAFRPAGDGAADPLAELGPGLPEDDPLAAFLAGDAGARPPAAQGAGTAPPAVQVDAHDGWHDAWATPSLQRATAAPPPAMPPAARPSGPPPARPTGPALATDARQGAQACWDALCAGAGLPRTPPLDDPLRQMDALGRLLRGTVDGLLQLIAVRAETRHELRAGVTTIRQRDNNPLKFSPDGGAALEQLLGEPLRGFLDGPAAVDDAMADLVGHAIGSVAGLRAAVEGMLERFAPQALEARLSGGSVFDSLLPGARKARLWDLYLQHHARIREEATEDFHTLFGKAFLAAYEQQIERLQQARTAAARADAAPGADGEPR